MCKRSIALLIVVSSLLTIGHARAQAQYSCDGGEGVYLYEHPGHRGRCVKVTLSESDLRRLAFDDQISSIRIVGNWSVTLYRDLGGFGIASTFTADQDDLFDTPISDNHATSTRVQPIDRRAENQCDGGAGVYLYEYPVYQGRCVKLTQDVPDLRDYDFDDTASSLRIIGNWTVVLARDLDGTGVASGFAQDDPRLSDDLVGDNAASSLLAQEVFVLPTENQCDGGEGVYLYEHPIYQGRCVKFTRSARNLRDYAFDNLASSLRIVGRWRVTLNTIARGGGLDTAFAADDPNLADDLVGDNRVSSLFIQRR